MQIIPHVIQGRKETVFHDFSCHEEGNELIVSAGTYYENGEITIKIPEETRINKPELTEWSYHEIWLTRNGIKLYSSAQNIEQPIDRLAWFEIYSPIPAERDIELHVINFEEF
jgi:hypothetical protein